MYDILYKFCRACNDSAIWALILVKVLQEWRIVHTERVYTEAMLPVDEGNTKVCNHTFGHVQKFLYTNT